MKKEGELERIDRTHERWGNRMNKRPVLTQGLKKLLDFVEIWVPVVTFALMFVVFVVAIFFRYVLNHPLTWPYELSIILFIWTILFGAGYAKREDSHVVFSVVYDRLSPGKQRISRILAETIGSDCVSHRVSRPRPVTSFSGKPSRTSRITDFLRYSCFFPYIDLHWY